MKTFGKTFPGLLPSLLFCSALGAGLLLGCGSGLVRVGTEYTGGSTSIGDPSGGNGLIGGAASQLGVGSSNSIGTQSGDAGIDIGTNDMTGALLSSGNNNAIVTGGYWWTYTDHNPANSPYHATISQQTSLVTAFQPTKDDAAHGDVLRIYGVVPPQLPWTLVSVQDPSTIDGYWAAVYPDARLPSYPAAGIGFGFAAKNAPYDATHGGKYAGLTFDMKIGVAMPTVWVSMPMVGTDLPDPAFFDAFPKQCDYYTATNTPVAGYQTCLTYHRKGFHDVTGALNSYDLLGPVGTWKHFCVLFTQFQAPTWVNTTTLSKLPAFNPTKVLKMQWDMYLPNDAAAPYDISLDNVHLITRTEATDPSNNCDPAMIVEVP